MSTVVPSYLAAQAALYAESPRQAALEWFRQARFGLFIHYGLYSALGKGEWVQFSDRIPVGEYEKLRDRFTACDFDADMITDLACEAEMRYVNLVTCHHDSFCLWDSRVESFNSVHSPCGRDLVGELAAQCARKGLGFFTYYTYHLNWRHPKFVSRDYFQMARPDYPQAEPRYTFRSLDDFGEYVDYVHAALSELLTGYGPLAGVWLDLIMGHYAQPDLMPVADTYALVRRLQPQCLVSFKQGATGDEDFATPERHFHSLAERAGQMFGERAAKVAAAAWAKNQGKHNEICATLQEHWWGYGAEARHLGADEVWALLGHAAAHDCNLLLNIGPLPDGGVHPADLATLRAVGKRLRAEGWPAPLSQLPPTTPAAGGPPAV